MIYLGESPTSAKNFSRCQAVQYCATLRYKAPEQRCLIQLLWSLTYHPSRKYSWF